MDSKIEIVYLTNRAYFPYLKMSIDTLRKFNDNINIHIVVPSRFPELDQLGKINVIEYNCPFKPQWKVNELNDRLGTASDFIVYTKLFFPKIFPNLNKILFLDGDIIVRHNLQELWDIDVPYIGGFDTYTTNQAAELEHENYFLAGMMIMNLEALRKDKFPDKLIKYGSDIYSKIRVWQYEESIINVKYYNKLTFLSPKYHYCHNRKYPKLTSREREQCEKNSFLLHFPGRNKNDMKREYNRIMGTSSGIDSLIIADKSTKPTSIGLVPKFTLPERINPYKPVTPRSMHPFTKNYFKREGTSLPDFQRLKPIMQFLKNKNVVLVGNAPIIFDKELGSEIDKADVVVRFNRGFPTKNIYKNVGSFTSIVVAACKLQQEVKNYEPYQYLIQRTSLPLYDNNTPYMFTDQDITKISKPTGKRCSTGYLMLHLCLASECKSITLYGFDPKSDISYPNEEGYKCLHNMDKEHEYELNLEQLGLIRIRR